MLIEINKWSQSLRLDVSGINLVKFYISTKQNKTKQQKASNSLIFMMIGVYKTIYMYTNNVSGPKTSNNEKVRFTCMWLLTWSIVNLVIPKYTLWCCPWKPQQNNGNQCSSKLNEYKIFEEI